MTIHGVCLSVCGMGTFLNRWLDSSQTGVRYTVHRPCIRGAFFRFFKFRPFVPVFLAKMLKCENAEVTVFQFDSLTD
jgi:hypothetical protein